MANETSNKFTREELIDRSFYRMAWNIHHLWTETGASDTRLLAEPIIANKLVTVGKSRKGHGHKEHVVPRVMLCEEAHHMFGRGEPIEAVAAFLKKYVKIVLITKDEQQHLDHTLGLKQCMPDGWSFVSGDPFARLYVAGIEFDRIM